MCLSELLGLQRLSLNQHLASMLLPRFFFCKTASASLADSHTCLKLRCIQKFAYALATLVPSLCFDEYCALSFVKSSYFCNAQGAQEAEKKSQAEIQALKLDKQAAAEQLKKAQADMEEVTKKLYTDQQAADEQLRVMQTSVLAVTERLDKLEADRAAAAKELAESKTSHDQERA